MADAHSGALSRRDVRAIGFTASAFEWWVRQGLIIHVGRGEYRIAGSSFAVAQEIASIVARAGRGAHISGALGLALLGVRGFFATDLNHIAVPAPRRVTGVTFETVSTVIPEGHRTRWNDLPMLIPERLFIGAAATAHPARVRLGWDDARFKGLVSLPRLEAVLADLGRAHGAPQMRKILPALVPESEPERDLLAIFGADDPLPTPQVWVRWREQYFRLDFAFLDARLDLEYDGRNHDDTREEDADRDLALKEFDIEPIRITAAMLRHPEELRRRILDVRRRRLGLDLPPIVPDPPPWL